MSKDIVPSVTIILPKTRSVDPKALGRKPGAPAGQRKLPPEPGRAERPTFVPDDEVLPRPAPPRK